MIPIIIHKIPINTIHMIPIIIIHKISIIIIHMTPVIITKKINIIHINKHTFFQHLNNLLENYLEPLKKETFLSNAEINALFGNIQEIVTFQRQFLQNLEEAIELDCDFHKFDSPSQFKVCMELCNLL